MAFLSGNQTFSFGNFTGLEIKPIMPYLWYLGYVLCIFAAGIAANMWFFFRKRCLRTIVAIWSSILMYIMVRGAVMFHRRIKNFVGNYIFSLLLRKYTTLGLSSVDSCQNGIMIVIVLCLLILVGIVVHVSVNIFMCYHILVRNKTTTTRGTSTPRKESTPTPASAAASRPPSRKGTTQIRPASIASVSATAPVAVSTPTDTAAAAQKASPAAATAADKTASPPQPTQLLVDPVTRRKGKQGKSETGLNPSKSEGDDQVIEETEDTASPRRAARAESDEDSDSESAQPYSMRDLRTLRKDYSRFSGEPLLSWLFRCWNDGAATITLTQKEARQLGSLAKDAAIDRAFGEKAGTTSLWKRLLSAVRERYPYKEAIDCPQVKAATLGKAIRYLEELAVREVIYNDDGIEDPYHVPCPKPMLQRFVHAAPPPFNHTLSVLLWVPAEVDTAVGEVIKTARECEEAVTAPHRAWVSAIKRASEKLHSPLFPQTDGGRPIAAIKRRRPPMRQNRGKQNFARGTLWALLCECGEDMTKWDKKPTAALQDRMIELLSKLKAKGGPSKKMAAQVSSVELPNLNMLVTQDPCTSGVSTGDASSSNAHTDNAVCAQA